MQSVKFGRFVNKHVQYTFQSDAKHIMHLFLNTRVLHLKNDSFLPIEILKFIYLLLKEFKKKKK